ncbi:MAG: hypothetical protein ABF651_10075 [Sporolactobacillus sp.]
MAKNDDLIRESSLIRFHVLSRAETLPKELWLERALELKYTALKHGLCPVSPLIMTIDEAQGSKDDRRFTFYYSLNADFENAEKAQCSYQKSLMIDQTLAMRHYQMNKPFSATYRELKASAEKLKLRPGNTFYHVMIPVYGDWIAEIHLPILTEPA